MSFKVEFLKSFDSAFGGFASSLLKLIVRPRVRAKEFRPKILVIRPGGIGDAALLFPALKELRDSFKDSEINVLAEKRNAGILMGCSYFNNLFLYDSRPPLELFNIIRSDYDIAIDTEQWHRLTAALSYFTGAPIRTGFATNEREKLFTHPVQYFHDDYEVKSFLNLVSAVTGKQYDFNDNEPFIPLDANVVSKVMHEIVEFRKKWMTVVGVFAGATIPERRWGIRRFAELTKSLVREGIGTVIVGGRVDIKDSRNFAEIAGTENILNLIGRTSLDETAAVISLLDLFVTGDTGLMHLSYGVGTPTVSLFGAGIQEKWAPVGKRHLVINKNLSCSPCTKFGHTPRCPYQVKCLGDITVNEVKEAVLELLLLHNK